MYVGYLPEAVRAVGKKPEALLCARQFLPDGFHTNAAGFVPGTSHCKRLLHVDLMLPHAIL